MRHIAAAYRWGLIALVAIIVLIVGVAVLFRYVFDTPLIFSFDLATILFVWMIFLGLTPAAHEGGHMAVTLVSDHFPPWLSRAVAVGVRILIVAISLFLIVTSWDLAMRTHLEIASMRISMIWVYMAMPVGFTILAGYEIWSLIMSARNRPIGRHAP